METIHRLKSEAARVKVIEDSAAAAKAKATAKRSKRGDAKTKKDEAARE